MSPRLFVSFLAATLILAGPACTPHVAQSVFTPVPSGLDSAATARWLTEQQRFCKGTFLRLIDEGAIGDSLRGDSLMVYRYTQRLTGVQCLNRRTTRLGGSARNDNRGLRRWYAAPHVTALRRAYRPRITAKTDVRM